MHLLVGNSLDEVVSFALNGRDTTYSFFNKGIGSVFVVLLVLSQLLLLTISSFLACLYHNMIYFLIQFLNFKLKYKIID